MIHRAGLLGDIHGQLPALKAALNFLKSQPDLDVLLCTGDLPERGETLLTEDSVTCCKLLKENNVLTIRGNHDRWKLDILKDADSERPFVPGWSEDEGAEFLASLPIIREFSTPLGPAMLCHGLGRDDMNGLYRVTEGYDGALHRAGLAKLTFFENVYPHKLVIAGHTHQRMVARFGAITVINAGALEMKTDLPTVGIVDFDQREVRFFDIDPATGTVTEAEVHVLPG
jgi:predicted phosphodiesterase